MTVIVSNFTYAPGSGPNDTLFVEEVLGALPVASAQRAFGLGAGFFDTGSNNIDAIFGASTGVSKQGSGTANVIAGLSASAESVNATVTSAAGVRCSVKSNGTGSITTGSAFIAETPEIDNSGVITTAIGVQIDPQAQAGISQTWGVYQSGSSDPNALAGSLSVGALSVPQAKLDVTGAIRSVPVTVAGLPGSPVDGMRAFVTNATSTTFAAAVAGSGTNHVPVYYDGGTSTWRVG